MNKIVVTALSSFFIFFNLLACHLGTNKQFITGDLGKLYSFKVHSDNFYQGKLTVLGSVVGKRAWKPGDVKIVGSYVDRDEDVLAVVSLDHLDPEVLVDDEYVPAGLRVPFTINFPTIKSKYAPFYKVRLSWDKKNLAVSDKGVLIPILESENHISCDKDGCNLTNGIVIQNHDYRKLAIELVRGESVVMTSDHPIDVNSERFKLNLNWRLGNRELGSFRISELDKLLSSFKVKVYGNY